MSMIKNIKCFLGNHSHADSVHESNGLVVRVACSNCHETLYIKTNPHYNDWVYDLYKNSTQPLRRDEGQWGVMLSDDVENKT